MIKLEQIGPFPGQQFLLAGNKAAGFLPVRKGIQHLAVFSQIRRGHLVQDNNHINIAVLGRFAAVIAALQADKNEPRAKQFL